MPPAFWYAARRSSEMLGDRSSAVTCAGPLRRLPSVFFLWVGDGTAPGVAVARVVPGVLAVGAVTGVIGPGLGGVVGALALGADSEDTTRIARISRALSTTTVMAARRMPRRGLGVGLLAKTAHS
jgi:hypothetical protein